MIEDNSFECKISKIPILLSFFYLIVSIAVPCALLYFLFIVYLQIEKTALFDVVFFFYKNIFSFLRDALEEMISTGSRKNLYFVAIVFLIGLFGVLNLLRAVFRFFKTIIRVFSTKLSIGTSAISGKVGFINTDRLETSLSHVLDVRVRSGLFGKIFNYARIDIKTISATFRYDYVKDAGNIQKMIVSKI